MATTEEGLMAKETKTRNASRTPKTVPDPDVPDATDVEVDPVDVTEPTEQRGEPVHRSEGGDLGSGAD
jgi:hypothetical protein